MTLMELRCVKQVTRKAKEVKREMRKNLYITDVSPGKAGVTKWEAKDKSKGAWRETSAIGSKKVALRKSKDKMLKDGLASL